MTTTITTITPNPSIDHTITVDELVPDAVHRATRSGIEPSGKGINVALALHAAGVPVEAVLPLGGATGTQLSELLTHHGLPFRPVPIAGEIRTNVTVIAAASGTTTKFNEAGPQLSDAEADALVAASRAPQGRGWVVWAGSLPGGFSPRHLAGAIAADRAEGHRVAVDSSGPAMRAVLAGSPAALPNLIKPNADELTELTGRPLRTVGDVVAVSRQLVARGIEEVLVSLGGDGAVLVTAEEAWYGSAPVSAVVNTAGAGDALLAGYLAASAADRPADQRLASALRFGADAVEQAGTLLLDRVADRPATTARADPDRPLATPTLAPTAAATDQESDHR